MKKIIFFFLLNLLYACQQKTPILPILGEPYKKVNKLVYPTIPNFNFIDQNKTSISNSTFANKIYLADFIFLNCPSICPKMTSEMEKVYDFFEKDSNVLFLSHTIDPLNDSINRLKSYSEMLKIKDSKWHFVTGSLGKIHNIAEKGYFSIAFPDSTAPGGFTHSGALVLVDKNRHVRGIYDGTNPKETKKIIADISLLLKEQFQDAY